MPTITISQVQTVNGNNQNVTLFNPFIDHLKLVVDFNLSADLVGTPNLKLEVFFEIIEFRTNQVTAYHQAQFNYSSAWGANLYAWMGSPSPHDWGLQWTAGDIFGFRAAVNAASLQGQNGLIDIDAMAVSKIRWFRLEDVFSL